jgi:hypothetical protein
MDNTSATAPGIGKVSITGIIALIAGAALLLTGLGKPDIYGSYLFGFVAWTMFTVGCLLMMLLVHATRSVWGYPMVRFFEAGAKCIPLAALLFIPIPFFLDKLFPWANQAMVATNHVLQYKTQYLNPTLFIARAVIYFIIFFAFTYIVTNYAKKEDQTGDEKYFIARTNWAAPGLVFVTLALTFGITDWVMSLDPYWFSTIFGLIVTVGCALGAMAACVFYLMTLVKWPPFDKVLNVKQWRDMGNLTLTLVILWGYTSFSQLIITWSGNLPDEITYFVSRRVGGWSTLGAALVFLHFLLPFLLLLSSRLKRTAWLLGGTCIFILVMRFADIVWMVIPSLNRHMVLSDVGAFLAMGGLWLMLFAWQLKRNALFPRYSLLPRELEHA